MGAGCYYTHKETGTKAFWIDIESEEDEEECDGQWEWDMLIESVENVIEELGYYHNKDREYRNGLFKVILESTYYGDGLVVRLEPHEDDYQGTYNLAMANHDRSYDRIKKALLKAGFTLRIATSGWTSTQLVA